MEKLKKPVFFQAFKTLVLTQQRDFLREGPMENKEMEKAT